MAIPGSQEYGIPSSAAPFPHPPRSGGILPPRGRDAVWLPEQGRGNGTTLVGSRPAQSKAAAPRGALVAQVHQATTWEQPPSHAPWGAGHAGTGPLRLLARAKTRCAISRRAPSQPHGQLAPSDWKLGQHLPGLSRTPDQGQPGPPPGTLRVLALPTQEPEKKTTITKTLKKNPSKSYL